MLAVGRILPMLKPRDDPGYVKRAWCLPMLEPWDDPGYVKRAWCLFELYTAITMRSSTEIDIIIYKVMFVVFFLSCFFQAALRATAQSFRKPHQRLRHRRTCNQRRTPSYSFILLFFYSIIRCHGCARALCRERITHLARMILVRFRYAQKQVKNGSNMPTRKTTVVGTK